MYSKVISIYSITDRQNKKEYAINLATALSIVAKEKVMLIETGRPSVSIRESLKLDRSILKNRVLVTNMGLDILSSERIRWNQLDQFKNKYRYIIVDVCSDPDVLDFGIFHFSDSIHLFSDSTKDDLEGGYKFFEEVLKGGERDINKALKVIVNRLNIFDKFSVEEMSWLIRRDIWAVVPEPSILDASVDSKGSPLVLRSQVSDYSKSVLRIAKREAGKLLGLALGSGAAFGLAHIGVLKILEKKNIAVDIISGSSIGAFIASLWGLGFSPSEIERIARRLKNKLNIIRLLDFTIPISSILAGRRLKGFLMNILREKRFEDLKIPVKIMVYDLANRETLVIEKGRLVDAVYTSIAVPGIFKPKVDKERLIVDGGVSDPVPVDILLKQGVKKIIAVNVLPGPEDIRKRNMSLKRRAEEEEDALRRAPFYIKLVVDIKKFFRKIFTLNIFDIIMTSMQSIEYVLAENSCKKASVVLRPVLSEATSIDFQLVNRFIKTGEEEASRHIKEIEDLISK